MLRVNKTTGARISALTVLSVWTRYDGPTDHHYLASDRLPEFVPT